VHSGVRTQRPQSSGIGNRGCQFCPAHPVHWGLNEGISNPHQLAYSILDHDWLSGVSFFLFLHSYLIILADNSLNGYNDEAQKGFFTVPPIVESYSRLHPPFAFLLIIAVQ
jgi:hypothetical protein